MDTHYPTIDADELYAKNIMEHILNYLMRLANSVDHTEKKNYPKDAAKNEFYLRDNDYDKHTE